MKKEVQLTAKSLTIDDLKNTDHVGIDCSEGKHYIVAIDNKQFASPCNEAGNKHCNSYAEDIKNSLREKVQDLVNEISVKHIYVFDTRKELYQWLAED